MAWARTAYCGVSWLIFGALLVQVFLAGLGIFGATSFDAHAALGSFLGIAAIALLVLARYGEWLVRETALLLGLMVLQAGLAWAQSASPSVAALHPLNALVIVWWSWTLAQRSRAHRATWPSVAAEPY